MVGKKEFVVILLDPNNEAFMVHIISLIDFDIYLSCRAQIALLIQNEVFIAILSKFIDFADVFSSDLVTELPENIRINNYLINLVEGQQPSYRSIYSLELIKFKTLKTYIKINLPNSFIRPLKSSTNAPILFV